MRLAGDSNNRLPPWVTALLIFVALIVVIQVLGRTDSPRLQQEFAEQQPEADAGQITLPAVPTGLADLARTTTARLLGGQASAPLVGEGQNTAIRVRIDSMEPEENGLHLRGGVTNISSAPVDVSLDSFRFIDDSGTIYASSGSPPTTLQPQQEAPIDLTLPIQNATQLRLDIEQPGQPTIDMLLIGAPPAQ